MNWPIITATNTVAVSSCWHAGISDSDIANVTLPTGTPILLELDENLRSVKPRQLLGDQDKIQAAIKMVEDQGKVKPSAWIWPLAPCGVATSFIRQNTTWKVKGVAAMACRHVLKGSYYTTRCESDSPISSGFRFPLLMTSQVGVSTQVYYAG